MAIWLVFLALGAVAGVLAGLLGIGGGLVLVAALAWIAPYIGIPPEAAMHTALASSLASIVLTATASARAHARRGSVMWPTVRWMVPGLLLGDLGTHLVHVEPAHALDHLVQRARRQRTGFAEHHDALADHRDGGDGADLEGGGEVLLRLGVDLAEHDVGVGLGRRLVGRREVAAGAAPGRPEVEEHDGVLLHGVVEVLGGEFEGGHVRLQ